MKKFLILIPLLACACAPARSSISRSGELVDEGPSTTFPTMFMDEGEWRFKGGFAGTAITTDGTGIDAGSMQTHEAFVMSIPKIMTVNGEEQVQRVLFGIAGGSDIDVGAISSGDTSIDYIKSSASRVNETLAALIDKSMAAYVAASADVRQEYNDYMNTARALGVPLIEALTGGLKILGL